MVFSVVSSAQEWLNVRWDEHIKEVENIEQEKKRLVDEAELVSYLCLTYCLICFETNIMVFIR